MNDSSERAIETSEASVEAERERAVARVRGLLALKGDEFCQDCAREIAPARRAALPSATRCIECQTLVERFLRGRFGGPNASLPEADRQ